MKNKGTITDYLRVNKSNYIDGIPSELYYFIYDNYSVGYMTLVAITKVRDKKVKRIIQQAKIAHLERLFEPLDEQGKIVINIKIGRLKAKNHTRKNISRPTPKPI